jgi:phosphoribosylaminoimidazole-succinocarboxamide synthase
MTTSLGHFPKRSGKVRDVYDLGDRVLIVATDRISAYDVVMPNGIPDKGRVLTQLSVFWFRLLGPVVSNHLISASLRDVPESVRSDELDGRVMVCKKANVVPVECIVRGFLAGSAWEEYRKNGTVGGIELPTKLKPFSSLPEPMFTASTKAAVGRRPGGGETGRRASRAIAGVVQGRQRTRRHAGHPDRRHEIRMGPG